MFFILGCNVSIVETLQNPILSDQFGLNVKATSYVFIGVLSIYLVSIIVMYVIGFVLATPVTTPIH